MAEAQSQTPKSLWDVGLAEVPGGGVALSKANVTVVRRAGGSGPSRCWSGEGARECSQVVPAGAGQAASMLAAAPSPGAGGMRVPPCAETLRIARKLLASLPLALRVTHLASCLALSAPLSKETLKSSRAGGASRWLRSLAEAACKSAWFSLALPLPGKGGCWKAEMRCI